jgi:hypothetical protein
MKNGRGYLVPPAARCRTRPAHMTKFYDAAQKRMPAVATTAGIGSGARS